MHVEQIQANLKLYQDAQEKLAFMMKQMVKDPKKQFYAIVGIADDFVLYAGMLSVNTLIRVDLWRDFLDGTNPKVIASDVPYLDFIRAFPEFGRRDIWKADWDQCQKLFDKSKEREDP